MESRPLLRARLKTRGATEAEAEDIIQETMMHVFRRWADIADPLAFATTVATRELMRLPRARLSRLAPLEERSFPEEPLSPISVVDEADAVRELLGRLPEKQRLVVSLRMDGYRTNEIAGLLQIHPSSVRVHLHRARQALREALDESEAAEWQR